MCVIDLFSKYAWVFPLKDKKGINIVNAFQKIISKGGKPNKIWVDQGSKFYNNYFKEILGINVFKMFQNSKCIQLLMKKNLLLLKDLLEL